MREILATCVLEDVDRESMWGAVCDLERYTFECGARPAGSASSLYIRI